MAIEVQFFTDFQKRKNSTKLPTGGTSYGCSIKDGCSILSPEIEVYYSGDNPASLNYAYIPKYKRYYFVSDWTYLRGIWTAQLTEDVLASYKTQIGNLSKYINRCSHEFNGQYTDTIYPTTAVANIQYSYPPTASPFASPQKGSFIVGIVGTPQTNVPNVGGINYYRFTFEEMRQFMTYMLSSGFSNIIKDDAAGLTDSVVKSFVNPTDYITTCYWYPFEVPVPSGLAKVQPQVGWWTNLSPLTNGCSPLGTSLSNNWFSGVTYELLDDDWQNTITLPYHPQRSRGVYMDAEPYSQYTLHFEPWGDIPLDGHSLISDHAIKLRIYGECLSGMAALEVVTSSGVSVVRRTAQLGVPMSIAQIVDSLAAYSPGQVISSGVAGLVSASKKGSLKEALKNFFFPENRGMRNVGKRQLAEIGKDVISGMEAYNSDVSALGTNGSVIEVQGQMTGPYVKTVQFTQADDNNDELGRPLLAVRTIKNIPGYIECADGDNSIPCYLEEQNIIGENLTGGFFYE